MSSNNNSRIVVTNAQVCGIIKRFFGVNGEKKPASAVTTSGNSADILHSLDRGDEPTILRNDQTEEFYVCNLFGTLRTLPEADTMHVDCKKNIVQLFDRYHKVVACLGITIGHIHDIVSALQVETELA